MKSIDTQTIRDIIQFEKLSKCQVVGSILDDNLLYLVVRSQNIYDVIGKNGDNIKRLSNLVGKSLKVYLYSNNLERFVSNLFQKKVKRVDVFDKDGQKCLRLYVPLKNKRFIMGQKGSNIKIMGKFLKRQFDISDIEIVDLK